MELVLKSSSAMDYEEQEAVDLGTPSIESLSTPGIDKVCSLSSDEDTLSASTVIVHPAGSPVEYFADEEGWSNLFDPASSYR